jgi:hypothetical protein
LPIFQVVKQLFLEVALTALTQLTFTVPGYQFRHIQFRHIS